MNDLVLVVTGCGRSGTQYIKHVLDAAGLPCGHEQTFGPYGPQHVHAPRESSWLAVPYLGWLNRQSTALALTYRPPELVIGSYRRLRFLVDPRHRPFAEYALRRTPGMAHTFHERGELAALELHWRYQNAATLAHIPDVVYRPDAPPWQELAELAGRDGTGLYDGTGLEAAASSVSLTMGHHVSWPTEPNYHVNRDDLEPETLELFARLEEART